MTDDRGDLSTQPPSHRPEPTPGHSPGRAGSEVDEASEVDQVTAFAHAIKRIRRAPWSRLVEGALPSDPDGPALELGEVDTLEEIGQHRGATMTELADRLQITRSTATRAVERLENRGLAERYPDPDSRRTVRVRLTRTGITSLWALMDRRAGFLRQVFQGLDPAERDAMTTALPRVVDLTLKELDNLLPQAGSDRPAGGAGEGASDRSPGPGPEPG